MIDRLEELNTQFNLETATLLDCIKIFEQGFVSICNDGKLVGFENLV